MSAATADSLAPSPWDMRAEHLVRSGDEFLRAGLHPGASCSSALAWSGKTWAFPRRGGSLGRAEKKTAPSPDLLHGLTFKQLRAELPS